MLPANADVYFLNSQLAWRVGSVGRVEKTSDGGVSWQALTTGVNLDLKRVVFSTAMDGQVFGEARALLKTKDGGATWELARIDAPGSSDLNPDAKIVALSPDYVYSYQLFYDSGALLSKDGGITWQPTDLDAPIRSATGDLYASADQRYVRKSTDGGKTWQTLLDLGEPFKRDDHQMEFSVVSDKHLFLVRRYTPPRDPDGQYRGRREELLVTRDGGANWSTRKVHLQGTNPWDLMYLQDILQASNHDTVLLGRTSGRLVRSVDDGANWEPVNGASPVAVMLDAETLLSVWSDSILKSTDKGYTWTTVARLPSEAESGLSLSISSLRKLDQGAILMSTQEKEILLSSDQGKTRRLIMTLAQGNGPKSAPPWLTTWFFDNDRGLTIDADGHLLQSDDGGLTWRAKTSDLGLVPYLYPPLPGAKMLMRFNDRFNGWARLTDLRLYRTFDGGTHWQMVASLWTERRDWLWDYDLHDATKPNMQVVDYCVTASGRVIVVGEQGRITYSDDKGQTWMTAYSGSTADMRRIIAVGDKTLWAAGREATLLKSVDGGQSWELVLSGDGPDLNDVFFLDVDHGWAVGRDGLVLATSDGGKTWVKQRSGTTQELLTVQFTAPGVGWVTGAGGFLLTTGTGGF